MHNNNRIPLIRFKRNKAKGKRAKLVMKIVRKVSTKSEQNMQTCSRERNATLSNGLYAKVEDPVLTVLRLAIVPITEEESSRIL